MNLKKMRHANVRILVERAGGITAFAEKIGKSQSQASSFAGKRPTKGIGDKVAGEIEDAFSLSRGWMDKPHDAHSALLESIRVETEDFSEDEFSLLLKYIDLLRSRKG